MNRGRGLSVSEEVLPDTVGSETVRWVWSARDSRGPQHLGAPSAALLMEPSSRTTLPSPCKPLSVTRRGVLFRQWGCGPSTALTTTVPVAFCRNSTLERLPDAFVSLTGHRRRWAPPTLGSVPQTASLPFVSEIKDELEDLNKEIKKTANRVRAKLKCEFGVWAAWWACGWSSFFSLYFFILLHFWKVKIVSAEINLQVCLGVVSLFLTFLLIADVLALAPGAAVHQP